MQAATVAVTSTLAMVRAAEARGVVTTDVLARAGVTMHTLEDPIGRIAFPLAMTIWDELRERSGDPALQLHAPTALPFGAYRVIDYMSGASATVGEGFQRFARYFAMINPQVKTTVESRSAEPYLRVALVGGDPVPGVYVDYIFAALVGRYRMQWLPNLRVARVALRHAAPAIATPYEQYFRAPVRFGENVDQLSFPRETWETRMGTQDPTLARMLDAEARIRSNRAAVETSAFIANVRNAIARALADGAQIDDVARQLHVSPRTLQRRLTEEGTSFRDVSDKVRRELAEHYLTDTNLPIDEIAFLAGFSELRSFHRAFERWTSTTPGRWRRKHLSREDASG